MENQEIIKIINNLKGRRNYEEKKATKLGFGSLYAYIEDKILKKENAAKKQELELNKTENLSDIKQDKSKKKSCSCC